MVSDAFTRGTVPTDAARLKLELQQAIHVRLYPYLSGDVRWSKAHIPTLASLEQAKDYLLRYLPPASVHAVLEDAPGLTPFEAADGQPLAVMPAALPGSRGAAFADAFRSWVVPAALGPQTRARYDGAWHTVVSYAIANDMLHLLWPTRPALLESLLFFGMAIEMQAASLLRLLTSVRARHSAADLPMALSPASVAQWRRALKHGIARPPSRIYRPCTVQHLHALLRLQCLNLEDVRDKVLCGGGLTLGPRPSELIRVDVCDFLRAQGNEPAGTVRIRFWRRKNDLARRGHFPRLGRARRAEFDLVAWFQAYMDRAGFKVHPHCSKKARPHAPCQACGLLFRRFNAAGRPFEAGDPRGLLSTMDLTNIVRKTMAKLGEDPADFRARSLRQGCVTAGFEAGLPEYLVYLQTGHRGLGGPASVPAGRRYALLNDLHALFAMWNVFGL